MSDSHIDKLLCKVNNELTKIEYWMRINKLSINYIKTKFMIIGKKYKKDKIKISEHEIEQVKEIK